MDMQTIRRAICKNRGGLESADDSQLLSLWNSLDKATQEYYLQTLNDERSVLNATRNKPKSNV